MLKNLMDFVSKQGTSLSGSLERGIGLSLLAFSVIPANGSTIDIPEGACSELTCDHFCEVCKKAEGVKGLFNLLKGAVYNRELIPGPPLPDEEENSVMGFIDTFENTTTDEGTTEAMYHPYFCAVSKDWTHGFMFYKPQNATSDERHRLLLTLQNRTIQGIRDENVGEDSLHGELQGKEVFPVHLPLMSVIGTPESSFTLSETGAQVQVKTLVGELAAITNALGTLSTTGLKQLQKDINTDTKNALTTATTPLSTELTSITTSLDNLTKTPGGVLPTLEGQIKSAITEDGNATRTALGTTQTTLTKVVRRYTQASTTATKNTVDAAASDIKSTVGTDVKNAQDAITQHLDQELGKWQGTLDGTSKEQNNTLLSSVLNTVQSGYKKVAAQSEANHQKTTDELTTRMQALTGITLNEEGRPQGGSLLQNQQRILETIMTYTLQSPELYETINRLTQIFDKYGLLPDYYIESIRTMFYGYTQFSSQILPGNSILNLLREFPDLLADVNLKEYVEQFDAPIKNIQILARYMEVTDPSSLRTAIPAFMRLFGPKTPVFDVAGNNVYNYCQSAHFGVEDFGLYAWVKDIYTLLKDFKKASEDYAIVRASAPQDPFLTQTLAFQEKATQVICSCGPTCTCGAGTSEGTGTGDGTQTDLDLEFHEKTVVPTLLRLEELLEGKVDGKQVIPVQQFNGLFTYPEILQACVDKIKHLRKYSEFAQMERKFALQAKEFRDRTTALEQIVGRLSAVVENALWFYQPCAHHHHHPCHCPGDETTENDPNLGNGETGNDTEVGGGA